MIRTVRHCRPCLVEWLGDEPCFVCGQPGYPGRVVSWSIALQNTEADRYLAPYLAAEGA